MYHVLADLTLFWKVSVNVKRCCHGFLDHFYINWAWRRTEEPKKKPRLLPRLGQCPSLGRSGGFIYFVSKICKILALKESPFKLPAWTTWRCLALKPPYLPDYIFFINQNCYKFFLLIRRSFFSFFFKFFWIFLTFLNPRNYAHPNSLRLRFLLPYDYPETPMIVLKPLLNMPLFFIHQMILPWSPS